MIKVQNLSSSAIAEKLAAAKARIAAKTAVMQQNVQALTKAEEDARQAKGGLAINVHPSLLSDLPTSIDRGGNRGHVAPKFSTTLANLNRQSEVVAREMQKGESEKQEQKKKLGIFMTPADSDFSCQNNPYYDPKLDIAYSVLKDRKSR